MSDWVTADVAAVIGPLGVTAKQLRLWCERGVVVPVAGGGCQGCRRRFTLMQVVGIAVAAKVYRGERGCAPRYVRRVVEVFAATGEGELLDRFGEGATHFVRPGDGRAVLSGAGDADGVDVRRVYRDVVERLKA